MGSVEYRTLIEKHQRLTVRLSKLDEWIEELNSGVIVDFELKLRQFAREIGDVERADRFQLGNAIVDEQTFLHRAFADRTQTQSDLRYLEDEMLHVNPIVSQYGKGVFDYLVSFYPEYGLLSYVVKIPFYPITRQWRYAHMESQSIFSAPLEVPTTSIKYHAIELDHFEWRKSGIDLLAGYISEVNVLCEYDLNQRNDG